MVLDVESSVEACYWKHTALISLERKAARGSQVAQSSQIPHGSQIAPGFGTYRLWNAGIRVKGNFGCPPMQGTPPPALTIVDMVSGARTTCQIADLWLGFRVQGPGFRV